MPKAKQKRRKPAQAAEPTKGPPEKGHVNVDAGLCSVVADHLGRSVPSGDLDLFRHHKAVAAWREGADVLAQAGVAADAPGVVVEEKADPTFAKAGIGAVGWHRHWDR